MRKKKLRRRRRDFFFILPAAHFRFRLEAVVDGRVDETASAHLGRGERRRVGAAQSRRHGHDGRGRLDRLEHPLEGVAIETRQVRLGSLKVVHVVRAPAPMTASPLLVQQRSSVSKSVASGWS